MDLVSCAAVGCIESPSGKVQQRVSSPRIHVALATLVLTSSHHLKETSLDEPLSCRVKDPHLGGLIGRSSPLLMVRSVNDTRAVPLFKFIFRYNHGLHRSAHYAAALFSSQSKQSKRRPCPFWSLAHHGKRAASAPRTSYPSNTTLPRYYTNRKPPYTSRRRD